MPRKVILIALTLAVAASAPAASAAQKIYSYDPADARTRAYVDNGLTFIFDKSLLSFRMRKLMQSTQANVSATVEPADDRELGVPLTARLIGPRARPSARSTG